MEEQKKPCKEEQLERREQELKKKEQEQIEVKEKELKELMTKIIFVSRYGLTVYKILVIS